MRRGEASGRLATKEKNGDHSTDNEENPRRGFGNDLHIVDQESGTLRVAPKSHRVKSAETKKIRPGR
jgi:hypothetical protein